MSSNSTMSTLEVNFCVASMQLADAQGMRIRLPISGYDTSGMCHKLWVKQPFYGGDVLGYLKHHLARGLHRVTHCPLTAQREEKPLLLLSNEMSHAILGWETSPISVMPSAIRGPPPPSGRGRTPDSPALKDLKRRFTIFQKSCIRAYKANGNRSPGPQWLRPAEPKIVQFLYRVGLMDSHGNVDGDGVLAARKRSLFKHFVL